ncbi:MAG: hypothetical protein AAF198_03800 [Pseudomonadota bacterium]
MERTELSYLLHLGMHKTGSTFIQTTLKKNTRRLRKAGAFVIDHDFPEARKVRRRAYTQIRNQTKAAAGAIETLKSINSEILERARKAGAQVVIDTNENYIGTPLYTELLEKRSPAQFYPLAKDLIGYLTQGIDRQSLTMFLMLRPHSAYLRSIYAEGIRNLVLQNTLDQFLHQVDLASISFADLIADIQQHVDAKNFYVFSSEDMNAGPPNWLKFVFKEVGLSQGNLKYTSEVVRQSLSKDQIEKLIIAQENVRQKKLSIEELVELRDRYIIAPGRARKKITFPQDIASKWGDQWSADWAYCQRYIRSPE